MSIIEAFNCLRIIFAKEWGWFKARWAVAGAIIGFEDSSTTFQTSFSTSVWHSAWSDSASGPFEVSCAFFQLSLSAFEAPRSFIAAAVPDVYIISHRNDADFFDKTPSLYDLLEREKHAKKQLSRTWCQFCGCESVMDDECRQQKNGWPHWFSSMGPCSQQIAFVRVGRQSRDVSQASALFLKYLPFWLPVFWAILHYYGVRRCVFHGCSIAGFDFSSYLLCFSFPNRCTIFIDPGSFLNWGHFLLKVAEINHLNLLSYGAWPCLSRSSTVTLWEMLLTKHEIFSNQSCILKRETGLFFL